MSFRMSSSVSSTAVTIPDVFNVGSLLTMREKYSGWSSSAAALVLSMVTRLVMRRVAAKAANILLREDILSGK